MPGADEDAGAGVKAALEMLQKALPSLTMGSKIHTAVLDSVKKITAAALAEGQGAGDPSAMVQQLLQAQKSKMAGGANPPPGMPPMGGGGAPPPAMAA